MRTVDTSPPKVFLMFKHIAFENEGGADGIETFFAYFSSWHIAVFIFSPFDDRDQV